VRVFFGTCAIGTGGGATPTVYSFRSSPSAFQPVSTNVYSPGTRAVTVQSAVPPPPLHSRGSVVTGPESWTHCHLVQLSQGAARRMLVGPFIWTSEFSCTLACGNAIASTATLAERKSLCRPTTSRAVRTNVQRVGTAERK
jgi:hypothetical protein